VTPAPTPGVFPLELPQVAVAGVDVRLLPHPYEVGVQVWSIL